jgi:transketolase
MRDHLFKRLSELDDQAYFLTADLGYKITDIIESRMNRRFINVGVCEQNMIGVAAGLTRTDPGSFAFVYSIANFPTLRCLDQIRCLVAYHQLPVCVISSGPGYSYGSLGYTHHATQDISLMSSIEGLKVLSPSTIAELDMSLKLFLDSKQPTYLRLDKSELTHGFTDAKSTAANSPCIIYSGVVGKFLEESDEFRNMNIVSIWNISGIFDGDYDFVFEFPNIISVEENVLAGGVGSMLSVRAQMLGVNPKITFLTLPNKPQATAGSREYLLSKAGISAHVLNEVIKLRKK